jgi:hypothetical protein
MPSSHWIEKTVVSSLLFAFPAAALLARVYWLRFRESHGIVKMHFGFLTTLAVLGLYGCSILNIIFQWSVSFMVAWPLFGIALSFLGFGLAFSAPTGERWKLASANVLLLVLTLASIVLPN